MQRGSRLCSASRWIRCLCPGYGVGSDCGGPWLEKKPECPDREGRTEEKIPHGGEVDGGIAGRLSAGSTDLQPYNQHCTAA